MVVWQLVLAGLPEVGMAAAVSVSAVSCIRRGSSDETLPRRFVGLVSRESARESDRDNTQGLPQQIDPSQCLNCDIRL